MYNISHHPTNKRVALDEQGRTVANFEFHEDAVKVYLDHVKLVKLYREQARRMKPDIYYPDMTAQDNKDCIDYIESRIPDLTYVYSESLLDHGIRVVVGRGKDHDEMWLRYVSPTGTWEVGIHADGAGWVEHREWGEVAGLTIDQGELVDYDGCSTLPEEVIAILEAAGTKVTEDYY